MDSRDKLFASALLAAENWRREYVQVKELATIEWQNMAVENHFLRNELSELKVAQWSVAIGIGIGIFGLIMYASL